MPGSAEMTAPAGRGRVSLGLALGDSWMSMPREWPKLWVKYSP